MSPKRKADPFLQTIRDYIQENKMLKKGDRIAVGVSGGPDSVCLLFVLKEIAAEYGAVLFAVHVGHGIRGKEAEDDAAFVKNCCGKWNIPFRFYGFDVPKTAKDEKMTVEEAGREVRRRAFLKCMNDDRCTKLALAHQADDVAETMLLNLSRGTGLAGLASLRPVRGNVIRPLLGTTRKEIEAFLERNGIGYRTDSSNGEDAYARNRIRHHILPYLNTEINSAASEHFAETADRVREALSFIGEEAGKRRKQYVRKKKNGILLDAGLFRNESKMMQTEIVRLTVSELTLSLKDITREHIDAVLSLAEKQVGRQADLPYGLKAERTYEGVLIGRAGRMPEEKNSGAVLEIPSSVQVKGMRITAAFAEKAPDPVPEKECTKWIDYDTIKDTLIIRTREKGDVLTVTQDGRKKSLSDWFIDEKIPREARGEMLLLADGHEIVWVLGRRLGETYKIKPETKHILKLSVRRMSNGR